MSVRSVFKVAVAVYLGVMAVTFLMGTVLWFVLGATGVIGNFEGFLGELLGYEDFRFLGWRILQVFLLLGLVWVIVAAGITAGLAALYNRSSRLVGGIEVSLED